ncbi:efflux RND transporter periplasmic adaptor subunit [Desulfosediminicola sp.]|uniref:efflux RND transporter periplasmic adaptor subunit n=1 Tax=Desulfosediminicola sp. TaxID=2886825 RepID=UPI003AF30148
MKKPKLSKKLLFFIPIIAGVIVIANMVINKQGPTRPERAEQRRAVSVVTAMPMTIVPKVTGYGYVQPTDTWEALPEVSGKIVEIHPELNKGTFVTKGELLVRIDPQSYGLAESRSVASIMNLEAQLKELEQQRINTEKLLEIERQKLQLTKQELDRKRTLFADGFISASELDQEEKNLLIQQTSVDNLLNNLQLIPSQKNALLARKESDVSSLSERRLDIEKTVIRAPFDCRISEVNIELNQFTPAGAILLKAVNVSEVEIPVQLSPTSFSNLLSPEVGEKSPLEAAKSGMDAIREMIGISATVRVPLFSREAEWPARFMRTSDSVDITTGAITIFVSVQQPYEKIIPSRRPPLVPNLYAEVELQGSSRSDRYVLPFQAIHDGFINTVNGEGRLQRQKVEVEMVMGDLAIISQGLSDTVTVITTDLVPVIEGMLVKPMVDSELNDRIQALNIAADRS